MWCLGVRAPRPLYHPLAPRLCEPEEAEADGQDRCYRLSMARIIICASQPEYQSIKSSTIRGSLEGDPAENGNYQARQYSNSFTPNIAFASFTGKGNRPHFDVS